MSHRNTEAGGSFIPQERFGLNQYRAFIRRFCVADTFLGVLVLFTTRGILGKLDQLHQMFRVCLCHMIPWHILICVHSAGEGGDNYQVSLTPKPFKAQHFPFSYLIFHLLDQHDRSPRRAPWSESFKYCLPIEIQLFCPQTCYPK